MKEQESKRAERERFFFFGLSKHRAKGCFAFDFTSMVIVPHSSSDLPILFQKTSEDKRRGPSGFYTIPNHGLSSKNEGWPFLLKKENWFPWELPPNNPLYLWMLDQRQVWGILGKQAKETMQVDKPASIVCQSIWEEGREKSHMYVLSTYICSFNIFSLEFIFCPVFKSSVRMKQAAIL